jgi:hypothetical protein
MTTEQGEVPEAVAGFVRLDQRIDVLTTELLGLAERVEALESKDDSAKPPPTGYDHHLLAKMIAAIVGIDLLETLQSAGPYSAEDHELIKAHVRHPGALEAAKLKERIRCAVEAIESGYPGGALSILKAL